MEHNIRQSFRTEAASKNPFITSNNMFQPRKVGYYSTKNPSALTRVIGYSTSASVAEAVLAETVIANLGT